MHSLWQKDCVYLSLVSFAQGDSHLYDHPLLAPYEVERLPILPIPGEFLPLAFTEEATHTHTDH